MKTPSLSYIISLTAAIPTATTLADPAPINEIVVFSHSDSDTGNAFILSGGLVAAPPYFGGRLTNGPSWVEWLAAGLGLGDPTEESPVPAPDALGGTNYAVAGADTGFGFSDSCIGTGPGKICAPNVGLQIETFFLDGGEFDGDELVVVYAGANDRSAEIAARNMGMHVSMLAAAGAKYILVPNESRMLGLAPGAGGTPIATDNWVERFNNELARQLEAVDATFAGQGVSLMPFNLMAFTDELLLNAEALGITNLADPACPGCGFGIPAVGAGDTVVDDPDSYLFWDTAHNTRVVHELWGAAAAALVLDCLDGD
jgi:phospholipase/lecithinase/hemolysin